MKIKSCYYAIMSIAVAVVMNGCLQVDNDYDLSKINTDDVVIGDEFVAPVGKITTSPEELLGLLFGEGQRAESKAVKTLDVPPTFANQYSVNASLDQGIVDALSAEGSRSVRIVIVNPTELAFDGEIEFLDQFDNVVSAPFGVIGFSAASTNEYSYDISVQTLEDMSLTRSIRLSCVRKCPATITVDDQQQIEISFSIIKTGGISLKN